MLKTLLTSGVIGIVVSGAFALVTTLLSRHWEKQDKNKLCDVELDKKLNDLKDSIDAIKDILDTHISEDDERYAILCRVRILRFADDIINQDKTYSKGQFEQALDDITTYENYCQSHPMFKNNITVQSNEIIKDAYKKCAQNHLFLG